jgi:hypothetical protein
MSFSSQPQSSDIRVLQPYETTSLHSCPLYMLVVLEGT